MPADWKDYIEEKRKLASRQTEALKQPTPAMRLTFYHSSFLPNWRLQAEIVQEMDAAFASNDFDTLRNLSFFHNYLVAAVAKEMADEVALRLAVANKDLEPEKYRPSWWVENQPSMV